MPAAFYEDQVQHPFGDFAFPANLAREAHQLATKDVALSTSGHS
jgi:hypothetical protein